MDYRNDSMDTRRIYTAWDNRGDEERLFAELNRLVKYGVNQTTSGCTSWSATGRQKLKRTATTGGAACGSSERDRTLCRTTERLN